MEQIQTLPIRCVQNLLTQKDSVNHVFPYKQEGHTPLIVAAAKNHKDVVQVLLNNNADVNCKTLDVCNSHLTLYWQHAKPSMILSDNPRTSQSCEYYSYCAVDFITISTVSPSA